MWDTPDPPPAPDLGAANREGVSASLDALGPSKKLEAAAKLGTKVTYTDPFTGKEKTVDFTGTGDVDQARALLPFIGESADAVAKSQLEVQQKYGLDFVDQRLAELERSDPIGVQTRKEMGESILDELRQGSALTDEQRTQVTQAERAAQAARGNVFGSAPAAAEAMAVGDAGFRMKQQRLANAAAFLSGSTPVAQFGQISGAQAGASPFNPVAVQQGMTVNPNAGLQGQQFALNNYGNKFKAWEASSQGGIGNMLMGTLAGAASAGLTGGAMGGLGSLLGNNAFGKGFRGSFG